MKLTKVFTLTFVVLQYSLAAQAAECKPVIDSQVVRESIKYRDTDALIEHLAANAGESDIFEANQGKGGLKIVIDDLVAQLFESHTANDANMSAEHLKQIKGQLEQGIVVGCKRLAMGDSDDSATKEALKTSKLSGGDSQYYFLLGTSNSLQANGSFSSGLEVSLLSTTIYPVRQIPFSPVTWKRSNKKVTGSVDLTYSEIGEIAESENGTTDPVNPFSAGGGFLRFSGSIDPYYTKNNNTEGLGFRIGVGFSTQPSEPDGDVSTKERIVLGVLFKANYGLDEAGRNGRGEIFIGYAYDRFWKYEETLNSSETTTVNVNEVNRILVDGRLDLPGVFKSEEVRLHARLFADLPSSGLGPSDIRISILLTVDIGSLFQIN